MSFIKHLRSITTEFWSVVGGPCSVDSRQVDSFRFLQSRRRGFVWGLVLGLVATNASAPTARSHDIPNQRVDRSIQVTVGPGRLAIAYEVSLSELTLTQDLRSLTGNLPGGDRSSWLAHYAEVTGPLNAKGLAVTVDGQPVSIEGHGYELVVEEHPRYTFQFEAAIPQQGRLSIRDRNFVSSEGTSRLGVRGRDGVTISGDDLPGDVEQIPVRPIWQLSDEEERRTTQVDVRYTSVKKPVEGGIAGGHHDEKNAATSTEPKGQKLESDAPPVATRASRMTKISDLLDDPHDRSWIFLGLLAWRSGRLMRFNQVTARRWSRLLRWDRKPGFISPCCWAWRPR